MERVYVVTIGAYSENRIAGIFSTKEKAKAAVEELKNAQEDKQDKEPVFLQDYPFDVALGQLYNFEIECVDGEWREISRYEERCEYHDWALKDRWGAYSVLARSFEEAVERAKRLDAEEAMKGK